MKTAVDRWATECVYESVIGLVDKILAAKRANRNADVSALKREIDQRVYCLYGSTAEETRIVEEGTR